MNNLYQLFFRQIDASALAVFRIGFGGILLFDCINYGVFLCLQCDYHDTELLFKYAGFDWVRALPTAGLKAVWLLMGVCAAGIMLGFYYRLSMVLFTLGFIYQFLLDEALYLNHFYMVILFCILMCFVPANRHWSLDARYRPQIASPLVPNWTRLLLGAQLEIILIHAGLVKINFDWLNLEPLRMWLTARSVDENALLQLLTQDWGIAVAAYGSIALHLLGAPLLLFRKTRFAVLCIYGMFHFSNAFVFNIGIFPWFTLFASLLLFDPDWPVVLWNKMRNRFTRLRQRFPHPPFRYVAEEFRGSASFTGHAIILLVGVWLTVQVVFPLRHWWRDGEVAWNEDGHRYSWRMKLRSKQGKAKFYIRADGGHYWVMQPANHLNRKQARKMTCIPDMVWQFAQFAQQRYEDKGHTGVKVYADVMCRLNGRDYARFVNPQIDLASIGRYEPVTNWIVPLNKPLKDPFVSNLFARLSDNELK